MVGDGDAHVPGVRQHDRRQVAPHWHPQQAQSDQAQQGERQHRQRGGEEHRPPCQWTGRGGPATTAAGRESRRWPPGTPARGYPPARRNGSRRNRSRCRSGSAAPPRRTVRSQPHLEAQFQLRPQAAVAVEVEPAHLAQFVGAEGGAPVQHRGVVEHQDFPGSSLIRSWQAGSSSAATSSAKASTATGCSTTSAAPSFCRNLMPSASPFRRNTGWCCSGACARWSGRRRAAGRDAWSACAGAGARRPVRRWPAESPRPPGRCARIAGCTIAPGVEESAVGVQLVLQRRGAEVAADIPRIADRHDAVGVGARVGAARPNNSLSARSSCLSSPCSLRNSRKPNSLRVRMIADCSWRDNFTSVLTETFTRSRSSVASNNLLSRFI